MKQCDLSKLLLETPESYYWIGFILADGHISKSTRLQVTLSLKDKEHLIKLQNFLNIEVLTENDQVHITGMDSQVMRQFCLKFNINQNKTCNPPNLLFIQDPVLLFALSIGFIDGDGCIDNQTNRIDCKLRVKCHSSWLSILNLLFYNKAYINNQGYANVNITNSIILKNIKLRALKLNLPILNRKWDKIDLNYKGRTEKSNENKVEVIKLLKLGKSNKEICSTLNIKPSALSQIIKRNNYEQYKPN